MTRNVIPVRPGSNEDSFFKKLVGFEWPQDEFRGQIAANAGEFGSALTAQTSQGIKSNEELSFFDRVFEAFFGRTYDDFISYEEGAFHSLEDSETSFVENLFSNIVPDYKAAVTKYRYGLSPDDYEDGKREFQELNLAIVFTPVIALLVTMAFYVAGLIIVRCGSPLICCFADWLVQKYKDDSILEEAQIYYQAEKKIQRVCDEQQKILLEQVTKELDNISEIYFGALEFSTNSCCKLAKKVQMLLTEEEKCGSEDHGDSSAIVDRI